MKYKSLEEVAQAESIFEAFEEYLKERNLTEDEFFETEEGRRLTEMSVEARFSMPIHAVKIDKDFKQK